MMPFVEQWPLNWFTGILATGSFHTVHNSVKLMQGRNHIDTEGDKPLTTHPSKIIRYGQMVPRPIFDMLDANMLRSITLHSLRYEDVKMF